MPGRYYLKGYVVDTINYDKLESEPVEFEIQKNTNKFTVELTIHNYMYGEGASAKVESLYGEATILYSSTVDGEYTTTIPVDVGTYFAKAIVLETAYYTGVESEPISFEVIKAENKFEGQVDISSWIYGETTSIPDALSKFGDIIFMYSKSIDGEYSETVPVNAGVYYLKVMVLETDNYAGLETIIEFKIEKANPVVTVPSDLTVIKGEKLSSVKLPSNWQWNEPEMVLKSEGKIQAKATYTPEDSDNYNVIEMSIEILVKPNHTILISVTSIIAITTTIGIIIIVKKSKNKKK